MALPHNVNNFFNIVNNIFYNIGDPIVLSAPNNTVLADTVIYYKNWAYGMYGLNTGNTAASPPTSAANVYSNNAVYGITIEGTFPDNIEFLALSGNLIDIDPQILAPSNDRWGLRQNSPCKGAGVANPRLF